MNVLEAWKDSLQKIQQGKQFTDDEARQCYEVENLIVTVTDTTDIKEPLRQIRAQSEWKYPSDEELKETLFAFEEEERRYAYGSRLFNFRSQLNQLDGYIIPLLREEPNTRRAIAVLADPIADDATRQKNYVSLLSVWFRVKKGKLNVTAVIRSNDFILGWPANIYQTKLLQEYVAERIHVPCGTITTISLSAHFFEDEKWLFEKIVK